MPSRPEHRRRVIWAAVIVAGVVLWWVSFALSVAAEDNPDLRKGFAFIFVFRALVSIGLLALAYRLMWRAVGPYSADGDASTLEPERPRHPAFASSDPDDSPPADALLEHGDRDHGPPAAPRHPAFEQPHGETSPRRDQF